MRQFVAKIHLWLSIPFGLIIAIVCLTGSILVFETEIQELSHPSRYFVPAVTGEPLSPAALIQSAQQQLPDSIQIKGIRLFSDATRTWQLVLPGKKTACFINPYTAEITGMDNGQGFFMQMMRLHRWLLDSYKKGEDFAWGKTVVGCATLAFVVLLMSGLVLWCPRNKKVLTNRLKIQTRAGSRRFFYDLHVSGGFYTAALLLVLSLTGLTWSFDWSRDAFYALFGVRQTEMKSPHVHATQPKDGASDRKQTKIHYTAWADLLSSLQKRYKVYNSMTIQDGSATVSTATYGNTRASDRYTFNPQTGTITDVQLYNDLPRSAKIRGWIYSVHAGTWGGLTTKIITCLVSLFGAILALTGYYLWLRKHKKKTN